jgi:hypothetical protein
MLPGKTEAAMKTLLLLAGLTLVLPAAARAESGTDATPQPAYQPGLGDLMTMSIQPRHIKLGLAGQQQNWAYATYELGELREALDQVAETQPNWNGLAIGRLVPLKTKTPLDALEAAIKAASPGGFARAYGDLTVACNDCHNKVHKAMIVIQVPAASPYPDQDFRPARK